jgi:hypothetical protein
VDLRSPDGFLVGLICSLGGKPVLAPHCFHQCQV